MAGIGDGDSSALAAVRRRLTGARAARFAIARHSLRCGACAWAGAARRPEHGKAANNLDMAGPSARDVFAQCIAEIGRRHGGMLSQSQSRRGLIFHVAAMMAAVIRPLIRAAMGGGERQRGGRGPADRGKGFRKGREPRRGLAAAELAASGLHAEPELDRGGRYRCNDDACCGDRGLQRRGKGERRDQRREDDCDRDQHDLDLGPR